MNISRRETRCTSGQNVVSSVAKDKVNTNPLLRNVISQALKHFLKNREGTSVRIITCAENRKKKFFGRVLK